MRQRAIFCCDSADRAKAERFIRNVAACRVPEPLRSHGMGDRVAPIQRLALSGEATPFQIASVAEAQSLIVLCTPRSANSVAVNDIIRSLKKSGRDDDIYAVVLEGAPRRADGNGNGPDAAFPVALFERYNSDGVLVTLQATLPEAPDVNAGADGMRVAAIELVAAMTRAPVDALMLHQRAVQARARAVERAISVSVFSLAALAALTAVAGWTVAGHASAQLERAITSASARVGDLAALAPKDEAGQSALRKALDAASADFDTLAADASAQTPALRAQRGRVLTQLSQLYAEAGARERSLELARAAIAALDAAHHGPQLTAPQSWFAPSAPKPELARAELDAVQSLLAALGDDEANKAEAEALVARGRTAAHTIGDHAAEAQFARRQGEYALAAGDKEKALKAFGDALELMPNPEGPAALEVARLHDARAGLFNDLSKPEDALRETVAAVSGYEAAFGANPRTPEDTLTLARALARQGALEHAADSPETLGHLQRAADLFARLRVEPGARIPLQDVQAELAARDVIASARYQTQDWLPAANALAPVIELRKAMLTAVRPSQDDLMQLAIALEQQGDALQALGRAKDALASFDEARSFYARAQAGKQLSAQETYATYLLWSKTARARRALGNTEDWGAAYATAIRTLRPIAVAQGAPPAWRRELIDLHNSYGLALLRDNRRGPAQTQYRAALAQVQILLAAQPDDPALQREVDRFNARIQAAGG